MSKYQIVNLLTGEVVWSGNAPQAHSYRDMLLMIRAQDEQALGQYLVSGKPVTFIEALSLAEQLVSAYEAKREITHKRIRVAFGVSRTDVHYKWVRR